MQLPIQVDPDRNYERVQIDVRVRFRPEEIADFIEASDEDYFLSIAYAQGLNDSSIYDTLESRSAYLANSPTEEIRMQRRELFQRAQQVIGAIYDMKRASTSRERALIMIETLRRENVGQLLHKTLLEFVGQNNALIRGAIRGRF